MAHPYFDQFISRATTRA